MKTYRVLLILFFTLMLLSLKQSDKITIFMIGDSTMANKNNPEKNPEFGWGQVFNLFFNDNIIVDNHAVNGRSSKSFITEGRWDTVLNKIKPGDYVFIQFGHNDQKFKDPKKYTNPYSTYRRNLEKYVNESRERGAFPILLSSTVRRNFNEFGTLEDTHGAYPFIAREVAKDMNVPFIDLQLKTENMVNNLGIEESKKIYLWLKPGDNDVFPDGIEDNTHFSKHGAMEVSKLAIEGIKELNLPLAGYINEKYLKE